MIPDKNERIEKKDCTATDAIPCEEIELLISMACDNECAPEDLEKLERHLRSCEDCRSLMKEYIDLRDLMMSRVLAYACPPPPTVCREKSALRKLTDGFGPRTLARFGGIAACLAFFLLGQYFGSTQTSRKITEYLSPIAVSTPSMWAAKTPLTPLAASSMESEQPFTESIERYRASIADELRGDDVDWMKVRDLVEAMGELRTDLELLTIHMAFLDIRTGKSPYDVAEHWEKLGGGKSDRMVYKP